MMSIKRDKTNKKKIKAHIKLLDNDGSYCYNAIVIILLNV